MDRGDSVDSGEKGNCEIFLKLVLNAAAKANNAGNGLNLKRASRELARHVEFASCVALDLPVRESGDDLDEVCHAPVSQALREDAGPNGHGDVRCPAADQNDIADLEDPESIDLDASGTEAIGEIHCLSLRKSGRRDETAG